MLLRMVLLHFMKKYYFVYELRTIWRETLAVGKFGEFTVKSYWQNKI